MYVPEEANWDVRLSIALTEIDRVRSFGMVQSDEDCYRAAGFKDNAHFWGILFSEPMKALNYTQLLARYFRDPMRSPCEMLKRKGLEEALCRALDCGETWFIRNSQRPERGPSDLHRLFVEPRKATEWLLSKPKRKHLIPDGLRCYLEEKPAEAMQQREKTLTGRPQAADWQIISDAIQHECKKRGALPSREGERHWRSAADVGRFVRDLLASRKEDASDPTIRRHVSDTLKRLAQNGFDHL